MFYSYHNEISENYIYDTVDICGFYYKNIPWEGVVDWFSCEMKLNKNINARNYIFLLEFHRDNPIRVATLHVLNMGIEY